MCKTLTFQILYRREVTFVQEQKLLLVCSEPITFTEMCTLLGNIRT